MKILEQTYESLTEELKTRYGKGAFHAAAVCREVFKKGNLDFSHVDEFLKSGRLLGKLNTDLTFTLAPVVEKRVEEGIEKFVTGLPCASEIESVVIPMKAYKTLCVSSQVGCKMACGFCETGKMGFVRDLTVEEIIGQVFTARFVLGHDIRNIVFMGMGEPLDNFDNVTRAVDVMSDQRGLDIPLGNITISTAGLVRGIEKLGASNRPQLKLAVSLNAPNDEIRSKLMPVNRTFPMAELKRALTAYPLKRNGSFLMEYVLIKDVNDSEEHAAQLAEYLGSLPVRLNLIPYNPGTDSPWCSPTDPEVHGFAELLEERGVFVRKRWSKGRSLMAGCGQLGNND